MRISQILEDLSERGCDNLFTESVTSLTLTDSEVESISKVIESFSKTFLESSGFAVSTSVDNDGESIVIENILTTKNGIAMGSVRHTITQGYRTEVHIAESCSGISSPEFVKAFREKGNKIVTRMLKS